jgi:hypothetical protein
MKSSSFGTLLTAALWMAFAGLPCGASRGADTVIADAAPDAPFDGVLLLTNGGVIRGNISRAGDRWIVKNPEREIEVVAKNVELACRSLEEAYDLRRKRIVRPTAEAHLALAEWSLRYELNSQAALELRSARAIDPRNPQLRRLDARLAIATRPQGANETNTPPPAQPLASVALSDTATQRLAAAPKSVTPRSAPVELKTALAETQPPFATPARLSEAVIERFTRKIQPVLVNSCTTAGCHQPGGSQKFQLDRALLFGLSNRHTTMNNLSATLALVDREQPQKSPLLTVPRMPHGGMDRPVFGTLQDSLVSQLVDWVALVADVAKPATAEKTAEVATAEPVNAANMAAPTTPILDSAVMPAASEQPPAELAPRSSGPRYGAQLQPAWQPKDAFDPEVFNRRFAGNR